MRQPEGMSGLESHMLIPAYAFWRIGIASSVDHIRIALSLFQNVFPKEKTVLPIALTAPDNDAGAV